MLLALYPIPILTICIVGFIVVFTYRLRKTSGDQREIERRFWERERKANATRRRDISNLEYINIPADLFPLNLGTETEKSLEALSQKQMLNLTGKSNTDLKLEYGLPNLEHLSECDDTFSELVRLLPEYVDELLEAGQKEDAQRILEFAVEIKADSRKIFNRLAQMYVDQGQDSRIDELIKIAQELDSLSKHVIISDLNML